MRVLVLAPQPFYQERGTPIAVRLLLRALSERGDRVDLLTFPEGEAVELPGLQIHRIDPRPEVSGVKPGFSFKKVYCDFFLARAFRSLLSAHRYDVVHATEESVFLAQYECTKRGIPFVYDMDSSMSGQIADRYGWTRIVTPVLRRIEAAAMRSAHVVVPMCEALADLAREEGVTNTYVLKDVSLVPNASRNGNQPAADSTSQAMDLRAEFGIGEAPLLLYIGNLEPYQGIDLALESFALARPSLPEGATIVLIGGSQRDVAKYRRRVTELGLSGHVHLTGPQPVDLIAEFMQQADLLLSPRTQGENTPMKVYTYLDSGVAVLATDLPTHRQVVDETHAGLAPPNTEAFAAEMVRLVSSPEMRQTLAQQARKLIKREHSYRVYVRRVHHLYTWLENGGPLEEPARAKA